MSHLVDPMPCFTPPARCRHFSGWVSLVLLLGVGGCASIPLDQRDPGDALEVINRPLYNFNEGLDRVALKPVSSAYTGHIPQLVRTGVSNFYDNIQYLDTVFNSFLQGKTAQGVSDFVRFGLNSTLGVLGLFDVATPLGLKQHREDFGQTLAVWRAGDGAYLVYPLLGPSSVRDTGGVVVSLLTNPIVYAAPPIAIPLGLLSVIDLRARKEGFVRFRDAAALDSYVFTRESYLQNRRFEIYDGNPPPAKLELFDETIPEPQAGHTVSEPVPVTPQAAP